MKKLRDKINKFMYGRNGIDALYHFLTIINFILLIVYIIIASIVPDVVKYVLLLIILGSVVYTYFRVFSKNISKRQNENIKFINVSSKLTKKIASFFKIRYNKIKYRKVYYYKKCQQCKKILRFKRIVGKHTATCPSCGNKLEVNIKR